MAITLFDAHDNELNHHDLQDKTHWCKDGESLEHLFVERWGNELGYDINPGKKQSRYVPDLINLNNGLLADLKVQNTPFFKSEKLFGIPPTYAVVFNLKDKLHYAADYPNIEILYWVDWKAVRAIIGDKMYSVSEFRGVFKTTFVELNKHLTDANLHIYQQRIFDDKGNARSSYVVDIRLDIFQQIM